MRNNQVFPRAQAGFALLVKLLIAAAIAALVLLLIVQCRGGPLTAAKGKVAADSVHKTLTTLVEVQGLTAEEIEEQLDTAWENEVARVRTAKGVTDWVDGFCAQLIELINNRIRSVPNLQQRRVWVEVLTLVSERCQSLQALEEPNDD